MLWTSYICRQALHLELQESTQSSLIGGKEQTSDIQVEESVEAEGLIQLRRVHVDSKNGKKLKGMNGPCKVYKRRWLMLLLFCLASMFNACHWIQYSIITNIVKKYYDVSAMYVNWSSMIYMAVYVPLVFPATWLIEKKGLRIAMILGVSMMTGGAWLKLLSLDRDSFTVAFAAQLIIGMAQIFFLSVPARLAGLWFDTTQVSTACALGVFGNELGIAMSFVLPPMVVHDSEDLLQIRAEFQYLHIAMAVPPTLLLFFTLFYFEAAPPKPPSLAQFSAREKDGDRVTSYSRTMQKLLTNKDYVLLLFSYGINVGVFYAVSTLLNQLFLIHNPTGEEEAGRIGLTLVVGGIVGAVSWGVVLDKTHMFKGTTLLVYSMGLLGMLGFTFSLYYNYVLLVYLNSAFLGFFMNGYLTVAYEFAAELTYPLPESTSSGLLNAVGEALGVTLVFIAGIILDKEGDLPTNILLSSVLLIGFGTSLFISGTNLRRLAASRNEQ